MPTKSVPLTGLVRVIFQDTTGCLIVARSRPAAARLAAYFRNHAWVTKEVCSRGLCRQHAIMS